MYTETKKESTMYFYIFVLTPNFGEMGGILLIVVDTKRILQL